MVYGSSRLQQLRQMSQVRSLPILLRSIQWLMKGLLTSETDLKTLHGDFRVSTLDTAVARDLYISGEFEEDIVQRAFSVLRERGLLNDGKVDVLLDVGANIGVTCISMMHMGLARRAVAVEPDSRNHKLLETNIRNNERTGSIIHIQSAVSNFEGTVELELSATNHGDHRIRTGQQPAMKDVFAENRRSVATVPVKTLDGIMAGLPPEYNSGSTLLWMDVQGHECHVIDGAPVLLSRGIPTVLEFWPYGMQRAGVDVRDFYKRLEENWTYVSDLNRDSGLVLIHEWRNLADGFTRPGDYTNLLLLP
jgi:FkbM family methyltransferase